MVTGGSKRFLGVVLGVVLLFSEGASYGQDILESALDQDLPEYEEGAGPLLKMFEIIRGAIKMVRRRHEPEFSPEELQEIALMGQGLPLAERWELMRAELARRHPGKIADRLTWMFNSAGNVTCQLALVYASPTEYVAFFGTPVGESGFSGRYGKADVWDVMVAGDMYTHAPGEMEAKHFALGSYQHLVKGTARAFRYDPNTWMIDYARGDILTMFPFGVINPALYTTLDFRSAWDQVRAYGALVIKAMRAEN